MQNENLEDLKEKELNLINDLRKIRVYSFDTAEKYSAVSKYLMRVQQQISIIENKK
tara:strand:+ start:2361 stop:2528 length:168 start_codon:yes stop_codon:yes gene_type:complete